MEVQGSLVRLDSWSRPSLKGSDILRTLSLDAQDFLDAVDAAEEERAAAAEAVTETVATLCTTQRGASTENLKQKRVVQIDVQCTPGSAFEDIIRQLENPALPTFKLADLPLDAHLGSPLAAQADEQGAAEQPPLLEQLDRLPFPKLDDRERLPQLPRAFVAAPSLLLPSLQPDMSMRKHWMDFAKDSLDGSSSGRDISATSDDRPRKRARMGVDGEDRSIDSSTDSGGSGAASRGKRLVCLRCGTHQTPQWRMGPQGPRTMCNACGVKYKKELREREKRGREARGRLGA